MISLKVLKALEYDKILAAVSEYAVLSVSKKKLLNSLPAEDYYSAVLLLDTTVEADKLLYKYGVRGVDFFDEKCMIQSPANCSCGNFIGACARAKNRFKVHFSARLGSESHLFIIPLPLGR